MDRIELETIVEQYCRNNDSKFPDIKVTRVADRKTVFVEQIGESGRAVMMNEYKVDGIKWWAGYSTRSQTVYISLSA